MIAPSLTRPSRQRGAAALIVVMVLVLAMSITFAFANRGLIFEQRTGANQLRSTQALEVAEAGIEWALAHLNGNGNVDNSCANTSGAPVFSAKYITANADGTLSKASNSRPGCVILANGNLNCSCPSGGANPSLSGSGGHFTIEFTNLSTVGAIEISSHGCTESGTAGSYDLNCVPGGTAGVSDGYAKVTVKLGQIPGVGSAPSSAITAKGAVNWQGAGSSLYVANTDANTNGITINAGGSVDTGANLISVPGTPQGENTELSVIPNDSSLNSLTGDQMFKDLMGKTKSAYHSQDKVIKITNPGNSLETQIASAISGKTAPVMIWVGPAPGQTPGSFQISGNNTFGNSNVPVTIVFNGSVHINGNTEINGLLYSTADTWDNRGGGNAFLRGAIVAEGNYTANGSMDIIYDRDILAKITNSLEGSSFTKLTGSWRDF